MQFYLILLTIIYGNYVCCSKDEENLIGRLLKNYNPLIQPVKNASSEPLLVRMTVQLVYIIKIIEKNQIMHTNVWLTLKWYDFQMRWDPVQYGGIKSIRIASDKLWLPDIVLFNNADGNYEVSFKPHVVVDYSGQMLWVPPAIYKSSCIIDVEFFPFDEQQCHMNFGSWTYNENEIKLGFVQHEFIDILEYRTSAIWDLIDAPATLVRNRSWIEYQIRIRRKALFYTVVLIIPTALMAFLSAAVFYLPTDSGEKITLTISVLLSIVVFLLLITKILPPTSSTIPLMAKYLLLTFVINVSTIIVTVVIINVYFRKPSTHTMPPWVETVFLYYLPKFLCLPTPKHVYKKMNQKIPDGNNKRDIGPLSIPLLQNLHHPLCHTVDKKGKGQFLELKHSNSLQSVIGDSFTKLFYPLSEEALQAIDAIEFITDYIKKSEESRMQRENWKCVAMVIDRFLLYVFVGITIGGTIGILGSAPYILQRVDQNKIIERLKHLYVYGDT